MSIRGYIDHPEPSHLKFHACGSGVTVRYTGNTHREQMKDCLQMMNWCEEQGWIMQVDYLVPTRVPEGKWHFRLKEQQAWFALRWS